MLHISTAHCILFRTAAIGVCSIRITCVVIRTLYIQDRGFLLVYLQVKQRVEGFSQHTFPVSTGVAFRTTVYLIRTTHSISFRTAAVLVTNSHTTCRSHHCPNTCDHQDTSRECVLMGRWREHVLMGRWRERVLMGRWRERVLMGRWRERVLMGRWRENVLIVQVEGKRPDWQVEGSSAS